MSFMNDSQVPAPQAPAPRGRKKQATRARIVECAVPLFSESGYDKITMESIAKAAGTSRANVYLHFKTKAEIVAAMLELLSPQVIESYRALDALDVDDIAGLRRWVETSSQLWRDRRRQLETLEHALAVEPIVTDRWYQTLSESADVMTRYLDRFPDGRQRRGARLAAITMMLGFERTLFFVLVRSAAEDFDQVVDALTAQWHAVLSGAAAPSALLAGQIEAAS
ncbi:Nucleoid occlusion factor SlmA [Rhodococcus ruber]